MLPILLVVLTVYSLIITAIAVRRPTIEKTVYKEIEVVKKAMCECGHVSSMHKDNTRCQQETFYLDGVLCKQSFRCRCRKYVGPVPMTQYFDDQLELTTTPLK